MAAEQTRCADMATKKDGVHGKTQTIGRFEITCFDGQSLTVCQVAAVPTETDTATTLSTTPNGAPVVLGTIAGWFAAVVEFLGLGPTCATGPPAPPTAPDDAETRVELSADACAAAVTEYYASMDGKRRDSAQAEAAAAGRPAVDASVVARET